MASLASVVGGIAPGDTVWCYDIMTDHYGKSVVLHIEADGYAMLRRSGAGVPVYFISKDLHRNDPTPLEAGDRATHPAFAGVFEIIAVSNGHAWCRWDDGDLHTADLARMERA